MSIKFHNRISEIKSALILRAKKGSPFPTYGEFGEDVGIWRMRGAADLLNAIASEEKSHKRPDITYILRSTKTRYPSQIGGQPAKPPSAAQKKLAHEEMQKIIEHYCSGATNPYPPVW